VHGSAAVIAAVMAAYNIAACYFRRDLHLRLQLTRYTLALGWEIKQTLHHLGHNSATAAGRRRSGGIRQMRVTGVTSPCTGQVQRPTNRTELIEQRVEALERDLPRFRSPARFGA
jgi:hypothetical protein